MNLIRAITLSVADADATAARYVEWFDYRLVERGRIDAGLAAGWHASAAAGRRFTVVRSASGAHADLRFVEADPVEGYQPLRTYGWAALELCVQDVTAVHARMRASPFEIIGPPSAIASLPTIHPMQVRGPDAEIVYLTEIKVSGRSSGLPLVEVPIDRPFICVLACEDMDASARWFAERFEVRIAEPITIPYRMINRSFGLAPERLHRLTTATHDGDIFIEFDQYPDEATARPRHADALPPGIAICGFAHHDLDAVAGPWLTEPIARPGAIYQGRRVGMLRMPDGTLVEAIEGEPA